MKKKQGKNKRSQRNRRQKLHKNKRNPSAISCNQADTEIGAAKATNSQAVLIHRGSVALKHSPEHELRKASQAKDKAALASPPRLGEWILYFLLAKDNSEETVGDLAEDYYGLQPKLGIRGATFWYYKQVVIILFSQVPGLIRWLIYAWIREHLRRWI